MFMLFLNAFCDFWFFLKIFSAHFTVCSGLLPSWIMVKSLTGPFHFRVTLDTLSGVQNPGPQQFWEVKSRACAS